MEKNTPLVSICMPANNAGKYISDAVNSILHQTYQNIELIIVNDGSTDHTKKILEKFKDNRIKIFHTDNNGQCAAANLAFKNSTGTYIKFMDADDLISNQFIENQILLLNNSKDEIATASWGRFYNDDLSKFIIDENNIIKEDCKPLEWLIKSMTDKQVMLQCGLWLIPRNILNKSGLWDESLSLINDFEFFIRTLLSAKNIKFTPDAILFYRSGLQSSLSSGKTKKAALSAFKSTEMGTSYILSVENSSRTRQLSANCYQTFVYSFYPNYKMLTNLAEKRIQNLGGATMIFPSGGWTKILVNLFGWKASKIMKALILKYF